MGFNHVATVTQYNIASGATLVLASTLDPGAGDLLVVYVAWEDTNTTVLTFAGGTNSFTMKAVSTSGGNYSQLGFVESASATVNETYTLTLNAAAPYKYFAVLQFTKDAGDTVSFDAGPSPGGGWTNSILSGNITTGAGLNDIVVVAGYKNYTGTRTESAEQIGDIAADGLTNWGTPDLAEVWYKFFNASQTNIHAQLTVDGAAVYWLCDLLSFKSVAAAGGSKVPLIMAQMNQFGGGARW